MAQTVDTSMYNTDPNQGMNRLMSAMEMQGVGTRNNLLQQEYQGNQGLATLWQNAPRDADGNPDPNYIIQNAGQAGTKASDAIQAAMAIQGQKADVQRKLVGLDSDKLQLGKQVNDAIVSTTTPLLTDLKKSMDNASYDPDTFRSTLTSSMADLVNSSRGPDGKPVITPQSTLGIIQKLDFNDPKALYQRLQNRAASAQAWDGHLEDALNLKRGMLGSAAVGGNTQPTTQDMVTGAVSPAGPAVPTGQSFNVNSGRTNYNSNTTSPANPFSAANPNNPNNPPQAASNPGKPPMPGSPGTTVQGAPRTAAFMPPDTNNENLPEAPPGYQDNLTAGLARAHDAMTHANDVTGLAAPLKGVLQLANSAGPNEPILNKFRAAVADSPLSGLFDQNNDKAAKFEILTKFANDVAGQSMSANARNQIESAAQELSNPNSKQLPQAIQTVAKYLLARTDAAKAYGNYMSKVASDPSVTPGKITDAETAWRNNYDQNLFELPYQNEDEKKNIIGAMPDKDRKDFMDKGAFMAKQGLINPDDL